MSTSTKKGNSGKPQVSKKETTGKQQSKQGEKSSKAKQANAKPSKQQGQAEDISREQKLQAIILGDSFTKTFRPITLECPKVLLPLVNIPMIDYTIEFLSQNGVEEIFVFCVWHADMVEEYLKKSKWNDHLSIRCITSLSCSSAGDALRELDSMNIIHSDPFILISGDVVSNLNLKKAIAYHKRKRAEDSNNVMTLVLKKVQKSAGAKPILDDLVVVMNSQSQILLFDDSFHKNNLSVPVELIKNNHGLTFSTEYLDCNVDICSPELMLQFSDNFDYQDIRKDFIHNEVSNLALGKHIYGYVIQNEYAARVQDPRSYHSICRDIVTRWVYPLVPDVQLLHQLDGSSYIQYKKYIYREQDTRKFSRHVNITEEVVIGRGCVIGSGTTISRSIVGRDVKIGENVQIEDSHIWQDVIIEDGVSISHAIICSKAIIRKGCTIPRGCIISYGVVVDENTTLPEFTRLTTFKSENSESKETTKGGMYTWIPDQNIGYYEMKMDGNISGNQDDEQQQVTETDMVDFSDFKTALRMCSMGCTNEEKWKENRWVAIPPPSDEDGDDDYDDYDDDDDDDEARSEASQDDTSEQRQRNHNNDDGNSSAQSFTNTIKEWVAAAISTNVQWNNVLTEIKSYKFACNKSFGDCLKGVVYAVLDHCIASSREVDGDNLRITTLIRTLRTALEESSLACNLIMELVQDYKDEVTVISSIAEYVLQSTHYSLLGVNVAFILQVFYDEDLVKEDAVLYWAQKVTDQIADDRNSRLQEMFNHTLVQQFLKRVEDGEDDDDEDDEDDEEN